MLRRSWPALLGLAACGLALLLFDWPMVGRALLGFDVAGFLLAAVPVTLVMFAARTLRWVAVVGLSFRPAALWHSYLQTAMAVGVSMLTPALVGEALKLKLARDAVGTGWSTLGAAFAIERVADVAALVALLAVGLGVSGSSGPILACAAALATAGVAFAPGFLRLAAGWPLPTPVSHALRPLASFKPSASRMALFGLGTALNWVCVLLLWQAVLAGAGVRIGLTDCAVAVSLVTFAVIASMVPGGIGVAEVSAWAVFSWLGLSAGEAEVGSVALRLTTLLVVALGLVHALPLTLAPSSRQAE